MRAAPGPAWCRAWSAQVDEALRDWLDRFGVDGGVAVVALGSYARAELCPASDVDLLLLHDGWAKPDLEALVRALCYPLWDAGLSVGHAVRTPKQAVQAAAARVDTGTALIDRRLVAGDAGLLDDLASRTRRWLQRAGAKLLSSLAVADDERLRRAGAVPGLLEPDLKSGRGGLRDLHSLRWAAACVLGEAGIDPLVGARYLSAAERRDLSAANAELLTARCALHLLHRDLAGAAGVRPGSAVDRLRLDLQDDVAARLGPDETGAAPSADDLLRRVGLAARTVAHAHARTWPRLLADASGGRRRRRPPAERLDDDLTLVDGLVEVDPGATLLRDVSLGWRAIAACASRGTTLGRASAERLRAQLAEAGTLPWDERARRAFVAALRCGRAALPAFADAGHVGLLPAYLPDWGRVRGRPQRNPLHRYDLDTHLLETVAVLGEIAAGDLGASAAELWAGLRDPDVLLVAAFLHDIGKSWPGDHAVVGADIAHDWAARMGFDHRRRDRIARLVRLHLLLPDVAGGRDLDDRDEIARVAARVGDAETLDALYLLSLADARATGPAAWSPWKDSLLARLHARVRAVVAGGDGGAPEPDAVIAAAAALSDDPEALAALLDNLPRRYLVAADAGQVAAHARLLAVAGGEVRAAVRRGPVAGTLTWSVVGADRRGFIADCAGVLAAHGVAVLDARAFTKPSPHGGTALDWFVVRDGVGVDWDAVERDLRAAVAGDLDVDDLVARRERRLGARPLHPPLPVAVTVERQPTVIRVEVRAADAPGLLYLLARALADAGADVVGARVGTLGHEVRDVFFLRPAGGGPDLAAVEQRLRAAAVDAAGATG